MHRCASTVKTIGFAFSKFIRRAASRLIASEKRVVALLMEGLKNKGIAERLGIQEQVVKNHLQHIFDKTGCSTRVELALYVAHHPGFALAIAQG